MAKLHVVTITKYTVIMPWPICVNNSDQGNQLYQWILCARALIIDYQYTIYNNITSLIKYTQMSDTHITRHPFWMKPQTPWIWQRYSHKYYVHTLDKHIKNKNEQYVRTKKTNDRYVRTHIHLLGNRQNISIHQYTDTLCITMCHTDTHIKQTSTVCQYKIFWPQFQHLYYRSYYLEIGPTQDQSIVYN